MMQLSILSPKGKVLFVATPKKKWRLVIDLVLLQIRERKKEEIWKGLKFLASKKANLAHSEFLRFCNEWMDRGRKEEIEEEQQQREM